MIRYFAIVVMLTILLSYSNLLGTEKKKGEAVPHRKWVGNISADGKQIIFVEGAVIKDVVFAGAHNLRLIYEKGKETSSICIADLINGEKSNAKKIITLTAKRDYDDPNLIAANTIKKDMPEGGRTTLSYPAKYVVSPDGKQIIFSVYCNQWYITDPKGRSKPLPKVGDSILDYSISPNGKHLAGVSFTDGFNPNNYIFVCTTDGADIKRFAKAKEVSTKYSVPVFIPETNKIMFILGNGNWNYKNTPKLCSVEIGKENIKEVSALTFLEPQMEVTHLTSSQDGTKLVIVLRERAQVSFLSNATSKLKYTIYLLNTDGSEPKEIIKQEGSVLRTICFDEEQNSLYYLTETPNKAELHHLNLEDKTDDIITSISEVDVIKK